MFKNNCDNEIVIYIKRDPYPEIDFRNGANLLISISKIVSEFIERWIFLKRSVFGYWNSVGSNPKIFSSLILSIFISIIGTVFVSDESFDKKWFITSIGSLFALLFWHERSSYHYKWDYLAKVYNDILKAPPLVLADAMPNHQPYFSYRRSMKIALVLDLIQMEMWSHPSFKDIFYEIAQSALFEKLQKENNNIIESRELIRILNKYTRSQIKKLVEQYQEDSLNFEKKQFLAIAYRITS